MLCRNGTLLSIALLAALLAALSLQPPIASAGGDHKEDDKMQKGRAINWQMVWGAKEQAKKSVIGILYYIPPSGSNEVHSIFETQAIFELSLRSPVVRVKKEEQRVEFRDRYELDSKKFAVVVTDWSGNLMLKYEVSKKKKKLPVPKIIATIEHTRQFVAKLEKDVHKAYQKGTKAYERKKWTKALKSLVFAARHQGFEDSEQARTFISDIEDVGRERFKGIASKSETDSEGAVDDLRKIAREFKGCAVETEALKLIDEIQKK